MKRVLFVALVLLALGGPNVASAHPYCRPGYYAPRVVARPYYYPAPYVAAYRGPVVVPAPVFVPPPPLAPPGFVSGYYRGPGFGFYYRGW